MRAFGPLVSTDVLAGMLGDPDLRLLDVRWYADPARRGRDAFVQAHLPGAGFFDLDDDLSAPGGRPGGPLGRHPWPPAEQVARVMAVAGVGPETRVVVYDDAAGAIAARAWYVLRAYGHERVAVLDGGLVRWQHEGRPTEAGEPEAPPRATFVPRLQPGWVVDKAEVAGATGQLLLDARAPERYRGETEPLDPRAGHIPGARNAPYRGNLTDEPAPVFRPAEALRSRYVALGAAGTPPVVYCGSGVTACHDLLALELAGLRGRLYAGSWSEWCADPELPVATGAESDPE